MKSSLFGLLLGLGLLITHVGCCSVPMNCAGGCGTMDCGNVECESCGCGDVGVHAPFGGLGSRIANHIHSARCGSGCGEIYIDEHINEPPVCDPCGCNAEFIGETCGTCPTALGRLRNLWGYRYYPSHCNECSTCGDAGGMISGGGSCSTCGSGIVATPHHPQATSSSRPSMVQPNGGPVRSQPTPATRPAPQPSNVVPPAPVPDPNAFMYEPTDERLTIGSGVPTKTTSRSVQARPASTKSKPKRPKLVTNPN